MAKIRIHHRTTYRYTAPVNPGPHRLMLRPRESRELRLLSNEITIVPDAELTWARHSGGAGAPPVPTMRPWRAAPSSGD